MSVTAVTQVAAQSITSGDITGTVTDPSGAAAPSATVTLTNEGTNASQNTVTAQQGTYRFAFLPSGRYSVTVKDRGFQSQERAHIVVTAGQPAVVDIKLALAVASETVDVSEAAQVLQTGNADEATAYNAEMIQDMPNPGGDITYIAQTAPGVVMNTQAGYGNFVADGNAGHLQPVYHQRRELQRSVLRNQQ